MGKGKQSEGLGDTLKKVSKKTGVEKLAKAILGDDCGCEERRKRLNELYSYKLKVINCPSESDIVWYNDFKVNRTLTPSTEQKNKISELYANIFNLPYYQITGNIKPYLAMVERLDNVFE
jgi:hypothetical protein